MQGRTIQQISGLVVVAGAPTVAAPRADTHRKGMSWPFGGAKQPATEAAPHASTHETAPGSGATTTPASQMTQAPGGGHGMVWVNLPTRIYHREGDRWYGKTKNGKYMTEADAIQQGYRAAKEGSQTAGN